MEGFGRRDMPHRHRPQLGGNMDPTITALIVAATSLLGNLGILAKVTADKVKLTTDRAATAAARDKDSQELHDKVLQLEFKSGQDKENIGLLFSQVADSSKQISLLNTQLAQVLTKMDSVIETLAELKKDFKEVRE